MSKSDVIEAVVSMTGGAQLALPPPVESRRLVLEARVTQSGSQTVTSDVVGS